MLPFKPCLPRAAPLPPPGPDWFHEIKHDGYRMLARRDGGRVRLVSRRGLDWAWRFPMIVAAVEALAVRSCIIDGEVIACDSNGLADFQLLRWRLHHDPAILCAFDLLELDGHGLRDEPIEKRKAELARLSQLATRIGVSTAKNAKNAGPIKATARKSRRSEDQVAFHVA